MIVAGILLVTLFLSSFAGFSVLAPIEGAVVCQGIVSVDSHRKQIQHLEGGIVEAILVRDGDHVTAGQVLVQLRDVQPAAELRQLERQYIEGQAVIARLLAERDDKEEIVFPADLMERADDASARSVMLGQSNVLASRRTLVQDKQSLQKHKIAQAQEKITGLKGQIKAKKRQQEYLLEELATVEEALAKKIVPRAQALKLRQDLAETDGDLSGYVSEKGRIEQSILEMRLQMSEARAERVAEITDQLHTQRALLFDLSQKIVAARDVLHRTKIVSPIDGIVVNLQIHTHDGVISAAQPLLEIVPTNDVLVVQALVDPQDIDEVRIGMPADVQLTSINRRQRVPLEGTVADLSADRLSDQDTGQDFYRALIKLVSDLPEQERATMVAGMGAEVFIRTGERTLLDYLLTPITRSLQLGMRES
jgi:HlyD family type I secretion membrane fusion protein